MFWARLRPSSPLAARKRHFIAFPWRASAPPPHDLVENFKIWARLPLGEVLGSLDRRWTTSSFFHVPISAIPILRVRRGIMHFPAPQPVPLPPLILRFLRRRPLKA